MTFKDKKSGQAVAKHDTGSTRSRFHVDYWQKRLYQKSYLRGGVRRLVPGWSVRLQHKGSREAFSLGAANASVAAIKAKEIANFLGANGWAATLARYKPDPLEKADVATVGEFLADVKAHSGLKPITVRRYAVKLRRMITDLAKIGSGRRGKAARAKYDYFGGGRDAWLAEVDAQPLDLLNPTTINNWQKAYVSRAGADLVKRKSAERSAASILRCTRALFAADITSGLTVKLPPYPFTGVKLRDPGPRRYHSDIDPVLLLLAADRELKEKRPQEYLALGLCFWGSLRRKEADLLTWKQIDFGKGQIHIRRTAHFEPKTEESQREIDLPQQALDLIRGFKSGSSSEFVLNGADPNPAATYDFYRCDSTWRNLNAWLRSKGVKELKAVHSLRKESGSLVAASSGIEDARRHLGHRDIRTTSSHYIGKKRRVEVNIGPRTQQLKVVG